MEVKRMKRIIAELPDDLALTLKSLAQKVGRAEEEIIAQSLKAYFKTLNSSGKLKTIGFGMWKDREDMKDSAQWVRRLRETEWQR
jgi:predicted transcriptional regulator